MDNKVQQFHAMLHSVFLFDRITQVLIQFGHDQYSLNTRNFNIN